MIDNQNNDRARLRFQLESKLFFQSFQKRRSRRVRLDIATGWLGAIHLWRKLDDEIIFPGESRFVQYGTIHTTHTECAKKGCYRFHGHISCARSHESGCAWLQL